MIFFSLCYKTVMILSYERLMAVHQMREVYLTFHLDVFGASPPPSSATKMREAKEK